MGWHCSHSLGRPVPDASRETLYTDGGHQTSSSRPASAKNSPKIRAAVAERLARLGVSLDLAANAEGGAVISRPDSRIPLYVLPTDEELMIARHTLALLTKGSKQQRFEKAS